MQSSSGSALLNEINKILHSIVKLLLNYASLTCRNGMSKNPTVANFGHTISKYWLRPYSGRQQNCWSCAKVSADLSSTRSPCPGETPWRWTSLSGHPCLDMKASFIFHIVEGSCLHIRLGAMGDISQLKFTGEWGQCSRGQATARNWGRLPGYRFPKLHSPIENCIVPLKNKNKKDLTRLNPKLHTHTHTYIYIYTHTLLIVLLFLWAWPKNVNLFL